MRPYWLGLVAGVVVAAGAVAQAPAFATDVLPILRDQCWRCHRGEHTDEDGKVRRPKGELRLDGKAWIVKGGKAGSVLAPGKPQLSPLYARTVLPQDHDDRMPASGEPLPAEQAEVLRRWIEAGASFGDWEGEPGPAPAANYEAPSGRRSLDLARVAAGLVPLPAQTIAKATGSKARVTPLWHGAPLLRVEFPGHEDEIGDADVAALAPLREHIGVLVLARTEVTDAACAQLARMPRLVRLDLRETKTGDQGIARLRALPELRACNLFATAVTDAAVPALAAMPNLEELRLWQSRVSPEGIAKLRELRPELDVLGAPDLPSEAVAERRVGRPRR